MSEPARGERHTVVLEVAYDGADFNGFVEQAAQRTVASELLAALRTFDPEIPKLRVASRTDSGVHARAQLTAFDTDRVMPMRAWVLGVGRLLPRDVAIHAATRVGLGYHPRFEAKRKRYRYLVHAARLPDPLLARRAWRIHGLEHVDDATVARMDEELASCVGTHDFAGFASASDERQITERTMFATGVRRLEARGEVLAMNIEGDGFLHNMVRILVGTVVDVGLGRLPRGAIARTLASRDRAMGGQTAPPDGLYLESLILQRPLAGERWPLAGERWPLAT
ncbi:MAG: tRNA pseudouridine(38-40) synthase TruA [Deltaproteobacteria bacterium]|nr:tRNA pseudouridine(38-40) synthase TruA [Deltaproteobacteria bacterium]